MTISTQQSNMLRLARALFCAMDDTGETVSRPVLPAGFPTAPSFPASTSQARNGVHVIVSPSELNRNHGTGPLVRRSFQGEEGILLVRTRDEWGRSDFGDWHVRAPNNGSRPLAYWNMANLLDGLYIRSVTCVPFVTDDFLNAIAIHSYSGANLYAWIMDDQNIVESRIPDKVVSEFLDRCTIRFATHPELAFAYERKFGFGFDLLPAIPPPEFALHEANLAADRTSRRTGIVIGSFWSQESFDRLCEALIPVDLEIDWYGNNNSPFFEFERERMAAAGLSAKGLVPEARLAVALREHAFLVVPVSPLTSESHRTGVSLLSLPGRILFALVAAHIPILVVGSANTCAARFVKHFDVGTVSPYNSRDLRSAIDHILDPKRQARYRFNAASIAGKLVAPGTKTWLVDSIRLGKPVDDRFKELFGDYDGSACAPELPGHPHDR